MAQQGSRKAGSLVVVGTGLKVAAHTTLEALQELREAEQVFYLVTDPATAAWLHRVNPAAATLEDLYAEGKFRGLIYRQMADRIVAAVRSGRRVCAAFYGHPGVFVNASHLAIRRLRRQGYPARMLPGISAEDCLFADLGVNPGDRGCQSFEATNFLKARRRFDPTSELLLWQVGVLGESRLHAGGIAKRPRLERLTTRLRRYYPASHPVVLYEAASFPACDPLVRRIRLDRLPAQKVVPMMTLYIPPMPQRAPDRSVLRWYEEG
ncbi:MAG: hypothetical protein FJW14_13015 [Acidimicrobiia bacterium]|nr:hypothetical protein [Acidimicrobiia bacterium]